MQSMQCQMGKVMQKLVSCHIQTTVLASWSKLAVFFSQENVESFAASHFFFQLQKLHTFSANNSVLDDIISIYFKS